LSLPAATGSAASSAIAKRVDPRGYPSSGDRLMATALAGGRRGGGGGCSVVGGGVAARERGGGAGSPPLSGVPRAACGVTVPGAREVNFYQFYLRNSQAAGSSTLPNGVAKAAAYLTSLDKSLLEC
jgi:hypothetical protein